MTLPEGWRRVRLGEVAETALGKMLDRGRSRGLPEVRYLRNVNVQWGRVDTDDLLTMELADDERDRFGVLPGDLLVCEGGEIGRAAIWEGDGEYIAFQKALHRIRPNGELNSTFLRYALELTSVNGTLERFATGSTIAHLPQQQLRLLPLSLPPLEEQRRIVEILEEQLANLTLAKNGVSSAHQRSTGFMAASLDALLRPFPRSPVAKLVSRVQSGRSFGPSAPPAGPEEWGIIKVSAMTWGAFRPDENKAIPAALSDPRNEIRAGDVLVSRANTSEYVGAAVYVEQVRPRLLLSDKSLRLEAAPRVSPRWLRLALSSNEARRQISRLASGTSDSMRNISQANLLSVQVADVPEGIQAEVVARALEAQEAAERLRAFAATARRRGEALRRALLDAAFSGRLTGQASDLDRAEEAAEQELVS